MKSIKFKMWINMMTVVAVLITVIWLLFAIFLQNFYEFAKEGEVKKSQKQYITMLENAENMGWGIGSPGLSSGDEIAFTLGSLWQN